MENEARLGSINLVCDLIAEDDVRMLVMKDSLIKCTLVNLLQLKEGKKMVGEGRKL